MREQGSRVGLHTADACLESIPAAMPARLPANSSTPPCGRSAAEFRIQELAGLVKTLRRGLKESQTKASEFVAAACKYEKEVGQQVRHTAWRAAGWAESGPSSIVCRLSLPFTHLGPPRLTRGLLPH